MVDRTCRGSGALGGKTSRAPSAAAKRALVLGGAIDAKGDWVGNNLVVVQTGDQLDRGNDDRGLLDFLERVGREAEAAGGEVHVLDGNHELMNVAGDFRYVSSRGFAAFAEGAGSDSDGRL